MLLVIRSNETRKMLTRLAVVRGDVENYGVVRATSSLPREIGD